MGSGVRVGLGTGARLAKLGAVLVLAGACGVRAQEGFSRERAERALTLSTRGGALELARAGQGQGGVLSLRTAEGVELAAASPRLFALTVSRDAPLPGESASVSSADAAGLSVEVAAGQEGGGERATLRFSGFRQGAVEEVACTLRWRPGDPRVRWGLRVRLSEGWRLERVQYPCVTLAVPLGTREEDDAAVLGGAKGGVLRKPGAAKPGTVVSLSQPGNLAAQFGCYYDDRAGFFTAAEDRHGHPKELSVSRTAAGLEFSWSRPCHAVGADEQAYEVVTAAFGGRGGAPADWRDAADLYKAWALAQPWCAVPFERRGDLPAWLKDGPAMVRFGRDWLAEPERVMSWLERYWARHFPQAPLITAYWGWEKRGSWVTPDYFPVYPTDAQFTNLVARTRALGCHAFPWPSGYHWTLTYNKRPDGGFEWDDRARFDAVGRAHAVHNRDGSLYVRVPSWLNGGETACLCGGDAWTRRWWNEEVCLPLTRRGCELIQIDQVVGANWPACYAPQHGHPPGKGVWMTEAFTRQLVTMREAMRTVEPDAVVCFEEPNEWFNHLVGLQDYRDCEAPREWASVFNYLYHEYLPCFQSNPRGNDRVMNAYCAADGQMPHLVPSAGDLDDEVLVNGGFEARAAGAQAFRGWERVPGYQGQTWTGLAAADDQEKRGGGSSLRLENATERDTVQVSQNVNVDERGLAAGGRYRLSAWLKTERQAKPNMINFAVFAPGLKSTGQGGQLAFPAAGAGWTRVSADFSVPAGAELLRIMCHASGEARLWVDDVTLEAVAQDGGVREIRNEGLSLDARFMRKWVSLYHGEGRPWLLYGRMQHPPRLTCATVSYRDRPTPAVFHNAFLSSDGRLAVVLANATREPQSASLEWGGRTVTVTLQADEVTLLK